MQCSHPDAWAMNPSLSTHGWGGRQQWPLLLLNTSKVPNKRFDRHASTRCGIPVIINSTLWQCIPWTEKRAPCTMPERSSFMYHQSFRFNTKAALVRWQEFKSCSELLPTAIPLSFKLSSVSKLCLNSCIPEETQSLMIVVPSVSILNYNPVNKIHEVPGCFEALTIFQNKQGLLSTLTIAVPDSQLLPAAWGLQLFLLSLNSRLRLQLHHMAYRARGSKDKTG